MSFAGWGAMTLVGQVLWGALFAAVFGTQAWAPGAAVAVLATAGLVAAYAVARSVLSRGKALRLRAGGTGAAGLRPEHVQLHDRRTRIFGASRLPGRSPWPPSGGRGGLAGACWRRHWPWAASAFPSASSTLPRPWPPSAPSPSRTAVIASPTAWPPLASSWPAGAFIFGPPMSRERRTYRLALSGPVRFIKGVGNSYFTVSLGLVPLLPAAVRRSWPQLSARPVLVALGTLVAGALLLVSDHTLFNGNYLLQQGATGAAVLTGRPALFPSAVWWALQLVALAGGALLAAVAATLGRQSSSARRLSYPRVLLVLFSILTAIFLCFFEGLTRGTVFDRYLWPLDFSLAVLLLARRPAPSPQARRPGHTGARRGRRGARRSLTGPRRQLASS